MRIRPTAAIFDFGQVLIDLDMERAAEAFARLGVSDLEGRFSLLKADPVFIRLELGRSTPSEFYESMRSLSGIDPDDRRIAQAWNSLLADYRTESLAFVDRLRSRMPVFLFSNTNVIHYDSFQEKLRETTPYRRLEDLFTASYFSHEMGIRKPDPEGYLRILAENGLEPSKTLFVDDHPDNIEGAEAVGLQTHRLLAGERIEALFGFLLDG